MVLIIGFNPEQQIKENLVRQLHHFPSGTAGKTIVHYAQMIESGKFCAFDYGKEGKKCSFFPNDWLISKLL